MEAGSSLPGKLQSRCCIAGGGPAGMMLGYLLARAGIEVLVLEKHADFLRDFRGDTVHPSTLETLHELGLLGEFLKRHIRRSVKSAPSSAGSLPFWVTCLISERGAASWCSCHSGSF